MIVRCIDDVFIYLSNKIKFLKKKLQHAEYGEHMRNSPKLGNCELGSCDTSK